MSLPIRRGEDESSPRQPSSLYRWNESGPAPNASPDAVNRAKRGSVYQKTSLILAGAPKNGVVVRLAILSRSIPLPGHWVPWLGRSAFTQSAPRPRGIAVVERTSSDGRSVPCPRVCPLCQDGWQLRTWRFFSVVYLSPGDRVLRTREVWQLTENQFLNHFREEDDPVGQVVEAWRESSNDLCIHVHHKKLSGIELPAPLDVQRQVQIAGENALIEMGWLDAAEAMANRVREASAVSEVKEVVQDLKAGIGLPVAMEAPSSEEKQKAAALLRAHLNGRTPRANGSNDPPPPAKQEG